MSTEGARTANIVFSTRRLLRRRKTGRMRPNQDTRSGATRTTCPTDVAQTVAENGPDLAEHVGTAGCISGERAECDVLELTVDMVHEALKAAWGEGNRCTIVDVQGQLTADARWRTIRVKDEISARLHVSLSCCVTCACAVRNCGDPTRSAVDVRAQ